MIYGGEPVFLDNYDEYTCSQCEFFIRDEDNSRIGMCLADGRDVPKYAEACPNFKED